MNHPGDIPHRRYNPLTGEWLLVSAHRTKRPWLGQQEKILPNKRPAHDPGCYLCPGGKRVSGEKNPQYEKTFVFRNDFPALLPDSVPATQESSDDLHRWENVSGTSRVICYSPRHDLTLPELPQQDIIGVIKTCVEQSR